MTKKQALIIIPYFGTLPEWFELFLLTCGANHEFHWLIPTDDTRSFSTPANVTMRRESFEDFKLKVAQALSLDVAEFGWGPYKLCDLKPFYGVIFADDIEGYDYWGFGDMDLFYGKLTDFISQKMFRRYKMITFHDDRVSGHFCLIRNSKSLNESCFDIPNWRGQVSCEKHIGIDEGDFSGVHFFVRKHFGWKKWQKYKRSYRNLKLHKILDRTVYAEELFTTPLTDIPWHDGTVHWDQPLHWVWERGRVYSKNDGHESPYIHFMNFKSSKWLRTGAAPWGEMSPIVHGDASRKAVSRIEVRPEGIFAA